MSAANTRYQHWLVTTSRKGEQTPSSQQQIMTALTPHSDASLSSKSGGKPNTFQQRRRSLRLAHRSTNNERNNNLHTEPRIQPKQSLRRVHLVTRFHSLQSLVQTPPLGLGSALPTTTFLNLSLASTFSSSPAFKVPLSSGICAQKRLHNVLTLTPRPPMAT